MTEKQDEIKIGDTTACKLCSAPFLAEFPYHLMGICGDCVVEAGNFYCMAHSGTRVAEFEYLRNRRLENLKYAWLDFERSEFKRRAGK